MMGRHSALFLLSLAGLVGGCSVFSNKPPPPCPKVAIVEGLGTKTAFRDGPSRDLTDVRFAARLADVTGGCSYDSKGARIDMKVTIVSERGPAADAAGVDVEYFVALTNPQKEIIAKENFTTHIDFTGTQRRAGIAEEITPRIPLPKGTTAGDYNILLGFQLTEEEVEFNRKRRGI